MRLEPLAHREQSRDDRRVVGVCRPEVAQARFASFHLFAQSIDRPRRDPCDVVVVLVHEAYGVFDMVDGVAVHPTPHELASSDGIDGQLAFADAQLPSFRYQAQDSEIGNDAVNEVVCHFALP
jgi:hypothetical protein